VSPRRLVVLASGQGTNLQAILDATRDGAPDRLDARVVGVLSHNASAIALARAERYGVPGLFVPLPSKKADREAWDAALADQVAAMTPDLVVLAGWMRILGTSFLDRFPGRVINLHPALPGELPGVDAIVRAWDEAQAGKRDHTGVMVHVVVPEVDAGPVLVHEVVPIAPRTSLEILEAAVHAVEHRLIVEGVRRALAALPAAVS
jgi:phosphoribosylglycinamide formyltransferase-1